METEVNDLISTTLFDSKIEGLFVITKCDLFTNKYFMLTNSLSLNPVAQ